MPVLDLNELFLEPLLCCLGRVFWVMLEYPSTTRFQCPDWFQCPGPDGTWPRPSDAVQLSCPLSRTPPPPPPQNITFSTFMFDGGDGVLGVIGSIPPPWVELMPKSWILVSSENNTFSHFSSESLANFKRACTCAFLSRGTLRALQDFSPSRRSLLPIVFLVTMVQLTWDHWQGPRV